MEHPEDIDALHRQYLEFYPEETTRLVPFGAFLQRTAFKDLYDRKNFDGHITASAFIVDQTGANMLLLKHKRLGRWLQPGGHVDYTDDNMLVAATRECTEETGIDPATLRLLSLPGHLAFPLDIDSHIIPANAARMGAAHVHHDVRFLFVYAGDPGLLINEEEATGYKWIALKALEGDGTFARVAKKIAAFL